MEVIKLKDEYIKLGQALKAAGCVDTGLEARMGERVYEFEAVIEPVPDKGGAYVRFPYDIWKEFGKGRVKAEVTFDGETIKIEK